MDGLKPQNLVKTLYRTWTTSVDEALPTSVLDMTYSTLSKQLNEARSSLTGLAADELKGASSALLAQSSLGALASPWLRNAAALTASLQSSTSAALPAARLLTQTDKLQEETSFTAPICDLFIEVFDLKENNWLRRQAIVVILQQFLGSTIERRVRDSYRLYASSDTIGRGFRYLEETFWPNGVRRASPPPRTEMEKVESRIAASYKLGLLIPGESNQLSGAEQR